MGTVIGRYALHGVIASGGMASVHLGRLVGGAGFSRTVAIKRLHPTYAKDPHFVQMFLEEARLAARVQNPNVVHVIDVVATDEELFLVMEYIKGESLSRVMRHVLERGERLPIPIVTAVVHDLLEGLHAAHEARDEEGKPLAIVHRDVSPQNVLIGLDGTARVLDFGIAKAAGRAQHTSEGEIKGKLAYMSPEQLQGDVTRQTDVFAAAIVLWEALAGRRLFADDNQGKVVTKILLGDLVPPSTHAPDVPPELDAIVMRGLERDLGRRYATAREMASELSHLPKAAAPEVADWLQKIEPDLIEQRTTKLAEAESQPSTLTFAATTIAKHPAPSRRRTPALLAAALGVTAIAAAVYLSTRSTPAAAPVRPPQPPAQLAEATTTASPPATTPAPTPSASATSVTAQASSAPTFKGPPKALPTSGVPASPTVASTPTASAAGRHGALVESSPY